MECGLDVARRSAIPPKTTEAREERQRHTRAPTAAATGPDELAAAWWEASVRNQSIFIAVTYRQISPPPPYSLHDIISRRQRTFVGVSSGECLVPRSSRRPAAQRQRGELHHSDKTRKFRRPRTDTIRRRANESATILRQDAGHPGGGGPFFLFVFFLSLWGGGVGVCFRGGFFLFSFSCFFAALGGGGGGGGGAPRGGNALR